MALALTGQPVTDWTLAGATAMFDITKRCWHPGLLASLGLEPARLPAPQAAAVPPGADGLLFVRVLGDGERDDPRLRGTAVGLSLRHGRAAWARVTLEGVAFGMRVLLEALGRDRDPVAELRVSGHAASLSGWNQVKADVLGCRCCGCPRRDGGRGSDAGRDRGRRLLRAGGGGRRSVPSAGSGRPDRVSAERYDALYQRYRDVLASAGTRRR